MAAEKPNNDCRSVVKVAGAGGKESPLKALQVKMQDNTCKVVTVTNAPL